jgi:hypothetical protein
MQKHLCGKSNPQNWAISVIFKKLPKANNSPKGKKFAQSGHPGFCA